MIFIDEPKLVSIGEYEGCIDQMTHYFSKNQDVLSVYQIGGLSAPGISDIDLVVIFNDEAQFLHDPRSGITDLARYLFVHRLFGTSKSLFEESRHVTFFHNYHLLYGEDQFETCITSVPDEISVLKAQWAREFLVRMLINMAVEREYGIYKIRGLLLHARGLLYDLEFLGADAPQLSSCLEQITQWRKEWFKMRPSNKDILQLLKTLWEVLTEYLDSHLRVEPLFLPNKPSFKIGRNIEIRPAAQVSASSHGPKLKWAPTYLARKLISIQHRVNKFTIEVPFKTTNTPELIADAFAYTARAHNYNSSHLPHFMPLTSSLVLNQ